MSEPAPTLSPRWYFWDGGFLVIGRSEGVVPPHAHHAIQVCVGLGADVKVRAGEEEWRAGRGFIVEPDAPHSFDGHGVLGAMLFVDPESAEGRWLRASLTEPITRIPAARLDRFTDELRILGGRPLEALEPAELVQHIVRSLSAGPPPVRTLDDRVARALRTIHASQDLRISLEEIAAGAFLSPSRFAHLFAAHVGLPFRRYLLWRKLTRAMVAVARGSSLSAAAYEGGFADAAHLTRTFRAMWGIPPSAMMRGDFFVIESPFSV